jgi:hypothetical protein
VTTTINLQISSKALIQAVTSLDLESKQHLLDVIEQQVFEAEEARYVEDSETQAEMEAVKIEYQQGEFMTVDDFIQAQSS